MGPILRPLAGLAIGVPKMTGIMPILDDLEVQAIRWLMATDGSFPVGNFSANAAPGQAQFLASTRDTRRSDRTSSAK